MTAIDPLLIESHATFEEGVTFADMTGAPDPTHGWKHPGTARIIARVTVAEEHSVDSYNQTFNCGASLTRADVLAIRDWCDRLLNADAENASSPISPGSAQKGTYHLDIVAATG